MMINNYYRVYKFIMKRFLRSIFLFVRLSVEKSEDAFYTLKTSEKIDN